MDAVEKCSQTGDVRPLKDECSESVSWVVGSCTVSALNATQRLTYLPRLSHVWRLQDVVIALHVAVVEGCAANTAFLLKAGADVNVPLDPNIVASSVFYRNDRRCRQSKVSGNCLEIKNRMCVCEQ